MTKYAANVFNTNKLQKIIALIG